MGVKTFGELLRQHRTAAGFSQEHLADLAHLSAESIGALERGVRRAPYRETVALISKALRLDDIARAELEAAAQRGRARGTRGDDAERKARSTRNLPLQSTSFVGREQDIAQQRVVAYLDRFTMAISCASMRPTGRFLNWRPCSRRARTAASRPTA